MKRRFFAALLCLCLLAATLPTATLAADPHDHIDWTELTAENIAEHVSTQSDRRQLLPWWGYQW